MHLPLWLSRSWPSGTRDRICWNQVALFKENGFPLQSPPGGNERKWLWRGLLRPRRGHRLEQVRRQTVQKPPALPGSPFRPDHGMVRRVKCPTQARLPQKEEVIPKIRLCPTQLPESQHDSHPQAAQGRAQDYSVDGGATWGQGHGLLC